MLRPLISALLILFAMASAASAEQVLLRLHGSNTIGAALAPELVKAWLRDQHYTSISEQETAAEELLITAVSDQGKAVAVSIKAHGSSTSFKALSDGEADIGMSSRPIKDKEVAKLAPLGRMDSPRSEFVLGLDGIAVIVHPDNPLQRLNKEQLRQIFTGELRDWRELGGKAGPIQVYARDDKSGTYDTLKSLVLGKTPLIENAQRFESNAQLSDAVSVDSNGIGFVGLPYVRRSRALSVVDGGGAAISPDAFTVATEDYALARRLFLYLPEQPLNPVARRFVEFALSHAGQEVVAETGFVSQQIITGSAIATGKDHPEYQFLTEGAERLSLNFRFHRGSAHLDNKARADIFRLLDYMSRQENAERALILIGFSDQNEAIPIHSLALSIERADSVADILLNNGVAPQRVRGLGPAVTVASNGTPQGREKNRRVEVWIR